MGGDLSKAACCGDCGLQQRVSGVLETDVNGVSSMKLHENNQRFLRAMAEGGKSDLILGLFSTTREFDVNSCDEVGETALHKAAKNGHVVVCHVLIKRGARHDIKNQSGKTALDLATENKHIECVEYLQDPGYASPTCVFLHLQTNFLSARMHPDNRCASYRWRNNDMTVNVHGPETSESSRRRAQMLKKHQMVQDNHFRRFMTTQQALMSPSSRTRAAS